MKFFYYSNRQLFTALIAAYIHLQKLPQKRIPSIEEILTIPDYDKMISGDSGVPYLIGEIEDCQVYVIYFDSNIVFGLQTIRNILAQRGIDFSKWLFFDIFKYKGIHNIFIRTGELLFRKLMIGTAGKNIAAIGIQKSYWQIIKMVNLVKEQSVHG